MQVPVEKGSWLNLTSLLEYNGTVFWDLTDYPSIEFSTDDQYIQLTQIQAKRLDLLAFDFYGDCNYMWVIQVANNIEYPNQIREGMVLRMPAKATIDKILTES